MGAPADRVRPLKNESPTTGGTQDDQGFPTQVNPNQDALSTQGVVIQKPKASGPIEEDELVYIGRDASGNMIFRDAVVGTEKTLTELAASAGGGITEGQHEALDTLVHDIDETSYDEVTYLFGGRVSKYTVWTSAAKTMKIREETYSYVFGRVSQVVVVQYDGTGAVKMTMTEVYAYSGSRVISVTRTKS